MSRRRKRKRADYRPPRPAASRDAASPGASRPGHEPPIGTAPSARSKQPPDRAAAQQLRRAEQQVRKTDRTFDRLDRAIAACGDRIDEGGAIGWRLRLRELWTRARRRVARARSSAALGLERMAIWFRVRARARRGRRRRQLLAHVANAQLQTRDEQASSALLAVLTERIARAGASDVSGRELADTVAQAERIIGGYQAQRGELKKLLAVARAKTRRWVHWAAVAEARGSPELAARARAYLVGCERDEAELQRGTEDCDAGCRRLRDAIEQLQALARRSGAP